MPVELIMIWIKDSDDGYNDIEIVDSDDDL